MLRSLLLCGALSALLTASPALAQTPDPKGLVGTWEGTYQAKCVDDICQGKVVVKIRSTGANQFTAQTTSTPNGRGANELGDQVVSVAGTRLDFTYPGRTKISLNWDGAKTLSGKPEDGQGMDGRENPARKDSVPAALTLTKK